MAPSLAFIHLGSACNLACDHCADARFVGRSAGTWSRAALARTFERLPALGVRTVALTGGEPTVQAIFPVAVEGAASAGLGVHLLTNGRWRGRWSAEGLRGLGVQRVVLPVDSASDLPAHGRTFEPSWEEAVAAGLDVVVITTVSRANLEEIEQLVDRFARARVRHLLQPIDSDDPSLSLTASSPAELARLDRAVAGWAERRGERFRARMFMSFARGGDVDHEARCDSGNDMIAVFPEGVIHPCLFLRRDLRGWPIDLPAPELSAALLAWDRSNLPRRCLRPICYGCLGSGGDRWSSS